MKKTVCSIWVLFYWATFFVFADVLIITNPETGISSLEKKEVKDIFTGKKTLLEGKKKIVIAVLEDSEVHRKFLRKFIKKTPSQFRNFWRRKVFTGEGKSPKTFKSEAGLIAFVAGTKGAIGYISTPTDKPVKVIAIGRGKGGSR